MMSSGLCELLFGTNVTFIPSTIPPMTSLDSCNYASIVAFGAFTVGVLGLWIWFLNSWLPSFVQKHFDRESRRDSLIGSCGLSIISLLTCMLSLLFIYGEERYVYPYGLVLFIPAVFLFEIHFKSRLRYPSLNFLESCALVSTSILLLLALLRFFPQTAFPKCDVDSLLSISYLLFIFIVAALFLADSSLNAHKLLTSEKLYLYENWRPIGYLVEKAGVWVKVDLTEEPVEE